MIFALYLENMEECDQKQIQLFIEKITSHDKNYSEIFASMKTIKVLIGKQPSLYQKLITNERNEVLNTANKIVSDYFIEHEKLVSVEEIVVLLQFLHNMCVGQQDFCNEMWSRMEGLFIKLLNIDGEMKLKIDSEVFLIKGGGRSPDRILEFCQIFIWPDFSSDLNP